MISLELIDILNKRNINIYYIFLLRNIYYDLYIKLKYILIDSLISILLKYSLKY